MKKRFEITATCYDKKGRIVSVGKNSYTRTHPMQAHFAKLANQEERQFLHAEVHALLKAGDKKVHKIKVERYTVAGEPVNAEPCSICKLAIKSWGVKYVEYTN